MNLNSQNILVVDDTPANLQLLTGMLKERGYRVRPITDAAEALVAAQRFPPDLILADITMPGMNGYDFCQQLKSIPSLGDIPVIFISALSDTNDKIRAFQVGGVDFITKPFQIDEVNARVQTHLELRRQKRSLMESYNQLKELERLKDNLTHMIIHDMRSPLSAIVMALGLMKTGQPPETISFHQLAQSNASVLIEMVNQLLDINQLEANQMPINITSCDLTQIATAVLQSLSSLSEGRELRLITSNPAWVQCDGELIRRVLSNLVGNAIKFTATDGSVLISIRQQPAKIRVEVIDNGLGVPEEHHKRIFEKFGQVKGVKKIHGNGLGLTFCKLVVEAHHGLIGIHNNSGEGSTFWFELPV